MRKAFIETLVELAHDDERVFLLTADLGWTVIEPFVNEFPGRFLNVGVAEQNMAGVATGLALSGFVPFVYSIASFASMRAYEQLRDGPILHHLPVRIVAVGGGYAYAHAGPTHYALEDLALYRAQPNVAVLVPADDPQTKSIVRATRELDGPAYLRLGKSVGRTVPGLEGRFRLEAPELIRSGSEVLFVACGDIVHEVITAADVIEREGFSPAIAVLAHLPSSPSTALSVLVNEFEVVVTVEDGYRSGGLAALIADTIASSQGRALLIPCAVEEGLSCRAGSEAYLRRYSRIDAQTIAEKTLAAIHRIYPKRQTS